jgi:hypothetical protein
MMPLGSYITEQNLLKVSESLTYEVEQFGTSKIIEPGMIATDFEAGL